MENENQVDTQNTENTEEVVAGAEAEVTAEDNEVRAEAKPKLSDEQQLAIHKREMTKLEKKLGIYQPKEQPKAEPKQSNEPDYARLAYLETKGINHPDDQKLVQDEANRLKLPLTDVLVMEHIKNRLEVNKDTRAAAAGMPRGKGRSGGVTQHDVEYWLAKGETPQGDQELAEKVIDARMAKEKQNKFSDELFTG